jgi:hypothetical protein
LVGDRAAREEEKLVLVRMDAAGIHQGDGAAFILYPVVGTGANREPVWLDFYKIRQPTASRIVAQHRTAPI